MSFDNPFRADNFYLNNMKGDTIYEMWRVEPLGPDGKIAETYYIFKIHEKLMSKEELDVFNKAFKEFRVIAKTRGIGMFSFLEIYERANERILKMERSGNLQEEETDVEIEVFNYATGDLVDLNIGLTGTKLGRSSARTKMQCKGNMVKKGIQFSCGVLFSTRKSTASEDHLGKWK